MLKKLPQKFNIFVRVEMTYLKRQKLLCYDRNITNTTLQYAALDILAQGSYVRSYLYFFYLNKVIFAVLDVSSLPLQKC